MFNRACFSQTTPAVVTSIKTVSILVHGQNVWKAFEKSFLYKVAYKMMHQNGQFHFNNVKPHPQDCFFRFSMKKTRAVKIHLLDTLIGGSKNKSRSRQPWCLLLILARMCVAVYKPHHGHDPKNDFLWKVTSVYVAQFVQIKKCGVTYVSFQNSETQLPYKLKLGSLICPRFCPSWRLKFNKEFTFP